VPAHQPAPEQASLSLPHLMSASNFGQMGASVSLNHAHSSSSGSLAEMPAFLPPQISAIQAHASSGSLVSMGDFSVGMGVGMGFSDPSPSHALGGLHRSGSTADMGANMGGSSRFSLQNIEQTFAASTAGQSAAAHAHPLAPAPPE
jgi:hypothetical protein